jgi:DNA repair exonuclease SbcCD ATPase subunit
MPAPGSLEGVNVNPGPGSGGASASAATVGTGVADANEEPIREEELPIYPSELVPGGAPMHDEAVHGEGQSTARPGMYDKREAQNRATAWAERHVEVSQQGPVLREADVQPVGTFGDEQVCTRTHVLRWCTRLLRISITAETECPVLPRVPQLHTFVNSAAGARPPKEAAEAEQLRQELDSLQEVAVEALAHKDAQIRAASVAQNKTYEELTVVTRWAKKLEDEMKNAQVLNEELRSKLLELTDHFERCYRARGRHYANCWHIPWRRAP